MIQPLEGNNFIVTDKDGNRFQLDNKNKTNLADAIDLGKEQELVGSIYGAAKGSSGSVVPVAGTEFYHDCRLCRYGSNKFTELFERVFFSVAKKF